MSAKEINKRAIVILGGGYGGTLAALRLASRLKATHLKDSPRIILVSNTDALVERVRLHQVGAGQTLKRHVYTTLLRDTPVEFLHAQVTDIDPAQQTINLEVDNQPTTLPYHRLIYALGSRIDDQVVPGINEYAHTLASMGTSQKLAQRLAHINDNGGQIVICGAGLTGIEAAVEIAESFPKIKVTIITSERFGLRLSKKATNYLLDRFAHYHISLRDETRITSIQQGRVVLTDNSRVPFDLCLWAGPFTAAPLAHNAGIATNEQGQIIVDRQLRSISHPAIFAAGDAASLKATTGVDLRMSCATALPLGAHAADNIAAELAQQPLQDFSFAYKGQCISLGRYDGIIQSVNSDDSPQERIITGRPASWIKETICRYTIWSLQMQRRGINYRWPKAVIGSAQTEREAILAVAAK